MVKTRRISTKMIRLLLILVFTPIYVIADENLIVDEKTIQKWGYHTIANGSKQTIKRLNKVLYTGDVYYPRFHLFKECFESVELVNLRILEVEEEIRTYVYGYDYRQSIVKDKCIFFINTDAQFFRLEFQPKLFELYKKYLDDKFA